MLIRLGSLNLALKCSIWLVSGFFDLNNCQAGWLIVRR